LHYLHIELDAHDILLAENLPVESYLDTGDRDAFANGGDAIQLHPEFNLARYKRNDLTWEALGCAPLVVTGPKLDKIRRSLARRAKRLERSQSRSSVRAA
jgi:hypothetical protein